MRLHTYRAALDELQALFTEGSLTKDAYLIAKRSINNQVFQVILGLSKTMPSEDLYQAVDETGFHSIEQAVRHHLGH